MSKNSVADIMKAIGSIVSALGVIGSFILGNALPVVKEGLFSVETSYNWGIVITGIFCSVIFGLLFFGFGEIITLLQANVDAQKQSLKAYLDIKEEEKKEKNARPVSIAYPPSTPPQTESVPSTVNSSKKADESNDNSLKNNLGEINAEKEIPQVKEHAPGGKVIPLPTKNSSEVQCPVCGQKQRSIRHNCFKCGVEFVSKRD